MRQVEQVGKVIKWDAQGRMKRHDRGGWVSRAMQRVDKGGRWGTCGKRGRCKLGPISPGPSHARPGLSRTCLATLGNGLGWACPGLAVADPARTLGRGLVFGLSSDLLGPCGMSRDVILGNSEEPLSQQVGHVEQLA